MPKPFVFTRIRQDVSAGECVAGMTSTPFVLFQSYFRKCCHRKLASSGSHVVDSGTRVIRGCGTCPKSTLLRRSVFAFLGSLCRLRTFVSGWKRGRQRCAPCCSQMCWNVAVFQNKTCSSKEIVSWRERRFHANEVFSRTDRSSGALGHMSVLVANSSHTAVGDPDLTEGQGDRDGQEGELDARFVRTLVLQCWCASISTALTLRVVCTSARMILTSVLATKASFLRVRGR